LASKTFWILFVQVKGAIYRAAVVIHKCTKTLKRKELRKVTCLFSESYLRSPIAGKNVNIMTPRRSTIRLPDYVTGKR
jgi:hypothetical protein